MVALRAERALARRNLCLRYYPQPCDPIKGKLALRMPEQKKTAKRKKYSQAEANKIIAENNAKEIALAKAFAASNPTNPKIPKNLAEAAARSVLSGSADALGTAAGMLSLVPGGSQAASNVSQGLKSFAEEQRNLVNQYQPDTSSNLATVAAQGLARSPMLFSSVAQDFFSPAQKFQAPVALASRYPQLARIVEQYGPTAVNMAYHAIRGGANDGMQGALLSSSGNLLGEQVIEPAVLKMIESRFPAARNLATIATTSGNVGGMIYEAIPSLYEYIQSKIKEQ